MSKARDLADFQGSASALTTGTLPVDRVPYVGRRNLIINGGFDVWQRGESSTADNTYATADRWFKYAAGDTSTWGKHYDTERGNCLYATADSTGYVNIKQRFEGMHIPASGQEFTFSVWSKVSTGTAPFRIEVWNLTDNSNILSNYNVDTITTEWQKFTVTFSMDASDSNDTFHVMIGSDSCVGGAIMYFNQAQLELGSVATPFEHRSYGEELALCQRYYQQSDTGTPVQNSFNGTQLSVVSGQDPQFTLHFRPNMRTSPTVTLYSSHGTGTPGQWYGAAFNNSFGSNARAFGISSLSCIIDNTDVGAPSSGWAEIGWTADAEL